MSGSWTSWNGCCCIVTRWRRWWVLNFHAFRWCMWIPDWHCLSWHSWWRFCSGCWWSICLQWCSWMHFQLRARMCLTVALGWGQALLLERWACSFIWHALRLDLRKNSCSSVGWCRRLRCCWLRLGKQERSYAWLNVPLLDGFHGRANTSGVNLSQRTALGCFLRGAESRRSSRPAEWSPLWTVSTREHARNACCARDFEFWNSRNTLNISHGF